VFYFCCTLQWPPPQAKAALDFFVSLPNFRARQVVTRMGGMPAF
jgi:hypothetical protein